MLRTACALRVLAALGGIGMASIRFGKGTNPPAAFAMAHGLLAAAALGAYLNLAYQWRQRQIPGGLVVVHAGIAVAGFLALAIAAFA